MRRQCSLQQNAVIANLARSGMCLPTCSGRSSGCGSPDGVIHQDSRTALENAVRFGGPEGELRIFAMVDEVSESGHRPPLPVCVGCGVRLDEEGPRPG